MSVGQVQARYVMWVHSQETAVRCLHLKGWVTLGAWSPEG